MEFGPVPVAQAGGAVLAHSVKVPGKRLKKGIVLGPDDLAALAAAGLVEVTVARLGPDDIGENDAALAIANALVPDPEAVGLRIAPPHTGRVNIHADRIGLARLDPERLVAVNAADEMITLATVQPWQRMEKGQMVATVKIIPYGLARASVEAASQAGRGAISLAPVLVPEAALIVTSHDAGSSEETGKGTRAIEARLTALGMRLSGVTTVPHEIDALSRALAAETAPMVLVLTASATSDPRDVGPEALRRAGGRVARFGLPVDPGNLLFHGTMADGRPMIGLPGCSRSPALNGADWVLERLAAGQAVDADDIARMGVGGLLKEMPGRRQPREG